MLPAAAFKEAVVSLQQSLSGGVDPSVTMSSLATSQVDTAIARGLPASRAEQAGESFNQALVQHLANGLSMGEAVALAERVFQAEASFPAPKSPQDAAGKSLASASADVNANLNALANTKTAGGTSAFDKSLEIALLKGMSFDEAVKSAQEAGQRADAMAQADKSPMSGLASGGAAANQFAGTSPGFQKTLSNLLAKGMSLDEAVRKAGSASNDAAAAARADAANPSVGVASGNLSMLAGKAIEGSFGKVMSAALAKGVPMAEAMERAKQADVAEQKAITADARSPLTGFSAGKGTLPQGNPDFDRALAGAISRGESPTQAIAQARQAVANMPREVQTANTSLASGRNVDTLLSSAGSSREFTKALGNALAKGVPVERAMALAKEAEAANAFRFPLSGPAARLAGANKAEVKITQADGKPLPSWVRYAPETKTFLASNVPDGGFPLPIIISAAGQQARVTISEGALRK